MAQRQYVGSALSLQFDSCVWCLQEAVKAAAGKGFCRASAHIVCVLSMGGSLVLKVVTMDNQGKGMGQRTGSSLCSLGSLD